MADYRSPTVVTPSLPERDITPLEQLVLGLSFDAETDPEGGLVYFHSWCGPSSVITMPVDDLRSALAASHEPGDSTLARKVAELLARHDAGGDPPDEVNIDLSEADSDWSLIFQDIVRRSAAVNEIIVTAAWTCTRMRPDGFGGSVMLITADAILYRSTSDMLEEMSAQPKLPAAADPDGHETRRRLEAMAAAAGWDSFTLLLLIARWLNENRHTGSLIDHLDQRVEPAGG